MQFNVKFATELCNSRYNSKILHSMIKGICNLIIYSRLS